MRERGRLDRAPDGQAAARIGPAAGDDERDRVAVALGVVVRGGMTRGAVRAGQGEHGAERAVVRRRLGGEVVALEDQLTRAVVRLGLDRGRDRAEQLVGGVDTQCGGVPRAQDVHGLVRLGVATAGRRLARPHEQRPLLEPDGAEQPVTQRLADRQPLELDPRELVDRLERRRQHAERAGAPQRVRADPGDPRAGVRHASSALRRLSCAMYSSAAAWSSGVSSPSARSATVMRWRRSPSVSGPPVWPASRSSSEKSSS